MRRVLGIVVLTALAATAASAQQGANAANPNRVALEQQFRERSAKVAQQRLGLTDAQLAQLEQTNARYAPQLNQLVTQERETRRQLRAEMMAGNQANQQHVSDLMDTSIRLQKQRIALVEQEQKDLSRFMSPTQRAGYAALQNQVRRRAQELSRGRALKRAPVGPRR
jgi:Spy/CpxP family protein refolding chaperone